MTNTIIQCVTFKQQNISEKIKEIEEYQTELARTRNGLDDTRLKNEQIIKNFSALIEV